LPYDCILFIRETDTISKLDQFLSLVHSFSINHSPKSKHRVYSIPNFTNCSPLLIDYTIKPPILDSKGAGSKPLILPKPNLVTLPHMPSITHFSNLCSPSVPFPKGGLVPCITAKQVWGTRVIFLVNYGSPQFSIGNIVSLDPGDNQA
jgi:hypothetical protein